MNAKVTAAAPSTIDTFEANAKASGALNDDGFFAQDDWEFELDMMQRPSIETLQAHLKNAPVEHETANFLKGYLMGGRTHFNAFD